MWEINSSSQILTFGLSILFGFSLAVFFDFLRGIRFLIKRKNLYIFFTDLFFWLFSAFCLFCFSLEFSKGEIRGYYIVGSLIGFAINLLTISKFTIKIFKFIFIKINSILKATFQYKDFVLDNILTFLKAFAKKISCFFKKYLKYGKKP